MNERCLVVWLQGGGALLEKLAQLTSKVEDLAADDDAKTREIGELRQQLDALQSRVDSLENVTPPPPVDPLLSRRVTQLNNRVRQMSSRLQSHFQVILH